MPLPRFSPNNTGDVFESPNLLSVFSLCRCKTSVIKISSSKLEIDKDKPRRLSWGRTERREKRFRSTMRRKRKPHSTVLRLIQCTVMLNHLVGLTVCSSCAGSHGWCKVYSMSRPEDNISQHSSLCSGYYSLSGPSFATSHESWWGDIDASLGTKQQTVTCS